MNNDKEGFTLIEVVLSVALLAIIMLMFSSLFNNSLFLSSDSQQIDNSSSEAQSKIELNNGAFVADKDITFTFSVNIVNGKGSIIESTTSSVDYSVIIYEGSSFNESGWSTDWANQDD